MRLHAKWIGVCLLIIPPLLRADGDVDAQKVMAQVPYNGEPRQAEPPRTPALRGRRFNAPASSGLVIIVHLDNTGVNGWTFTNPRHPALIPPGAGVQFRNDTADRTFVVTLPISLKGGDAAIKYPVLTRVPGAAEGRLVIIASSLNSDAYPQAFPAETYIPYKYETLPEEYRATAALMEQVDSLLRVRELVGDIDPATMPSPDDLDKYAKGIKDALDAGDFSAFKVAGDTLSKTSLKALSDRITALVARRKVLDERLKSSGTQVSSSSAARAAETARKNLMEATAMLAERSKELAENRSPEDARTIRGDIEKLLARIQGLNDDLKRYAMETAKGATDISLSGGERLVAENEKRAIENELLRLASDVPVLVDTIAGYYTEFQSGHDEAKAKRAMIKALDDRIKAVIDLRKEAVDKRVIALRDDERRRRRNVRTWLSEAERQRAAKLDGSLEVRNDAVEELNEQGQNDLEGTLKARFGDVDISECDKTALTCVASQLVPPEQTAIFTDRLITEGTPPASVFKFQVRFFDEADTPSNDTAYVSRVEKPAAPPNNLTWSMVGSVGQKRDPAIAISTVKFDDNGEPIKDQGTFPPCGDPKICTEGHKNHFNGSGQVQLKQRIADYFEGSATVQFKSGDLGVNNKKDPSDQTVSFSQYKFSVFADNGLALDFGKLTFAKPTNGISINEAGEGFRIIYSPAFVSGAYIIRRESASFLADRSNRDRWAAIAQLSKVPLSSAGPFRSISATWVEGKDNKDAADSAVIGPGYRYRSYGGELGYALPLLHINGNFGFYSNERNADNDATKCSIASDPGPCNGSGRAAMLTATRSFGLDEKNKPARSLTLTMARGSADRPESDNVDEGYVGETGGFAPDVIFLSTLVNPINTTSIKPTLNTYPTLRLGAGIANKDYLGLTYVETSISPLYVLVHDVFNVHDITSYSTTLKYHNYRLRREFSGARGAGHEYDLESLIEGPKGVKTTLGAAYYRPGAAIGDFVKKSLWSLYSNVSIQFGQ